MIPVMEKKKHIVKTPPGAVIVLDVPRDYQLGPAMAKLNERQQAFVMGLIQLGNQGRAYVAAGYPEDPTGGNPSKLAHDPKVQDAIKEVGQKMLNAGSVQAVKFLLDTVDCESAERKDRIKAAEMIMNRSGLHATTEHKVEVTRAVKTPDEKIKRIRELSSKYGIDAEKLVGGLVIEAEYEEVEEDGDDLSDLLSS